MKPRWNCMFWGAFGAAAFLIWGALFARISHDIIKWHDEKILYNHHCEAAHD